jgi:hypothetical protein
MAFMICGGGSGTSPLERRMRKKVFLPQSI